MQPEPALVDALVRLLDAPDAHHEGAPPEAELVAPPIYGRWPVRRHTVPATQPRRLRELNVDPRHRAAAGLGAEVVRENQERYVDAAWKQVGTYWPPTACRTSLGSFSGSASACTPATSPRWGSTPSSRSPLRSTAASPWATECLHAGQGRHAAVGDRGSGAFAGWPPHRARCCGAPHAWPVVP